MDIDQLLDSYNQIVDEIYAAFGYAEDWRSFPLEDRRAHFWMLADQTIVYTSEGVPMSREAIIAGDELFGMEIYTQRHLPKWTWRTETHFMALVDTNTDGNIFLMIFDASKEVTDDALRELYLENW